MTTPFIATKDGWVEAPSLATGGGEGTPGEAGPPGPPGEDGATGPAGPGFEAGGTEGQILVKASDDDYDTEWADPAAGSSGGTVSVITSPNPPTEPQVNVIWVDTSGV